MATETEGSSPEQDPSTTRTLPVQAFWGGNSNHQACCDINAVRSHPTPPFQESPLVGLPDVGFPRAPSPDLEPVERLIELEREAAGVPKRIQVAMLHQEDAQVQGLWVGWEGGAGR